MAFPCDALRFGALQNQRRKNRTNALQRARRAVAGEEGFVEPFNRGHRCLVRLDCFFSSQAEGSEATSLGRRMIG